MSLSQISYINQIDTQTIFVTPDKSGNSNRILLGNQDVSGFNTPTDLFIHQVLSPNDPNNPSEYIISYQSGRPSPIIDVIGLAGSGGTSVGNGTGVQIFGDFLVAGVIGGAGGGGIDNSGIVTTLISATSLATDSSGYIIAGGGAPVNPNYQGTLASQTIQSGTASGGADYINGINDSSLVSIDYASRLCTIQIFFDAKTTGTAIPTSLFLNPTQTDAVFGLVVTSQPTSGDLPIPSPAGATQNVCQGFYVNQQNQGNNLPVLFNWVYNESQGQILINLTTSSTVTQNSGDTVFFCGTLIYQF